MNLMEVIQAYPTEFKVEIQLGLWNLLGQESHQESRKNYISGPISFCLSASVLPISDYFLSLITGRPVLLVQCG